MDGMNYNGQQNKPNGTPGMAVAGLVLGIVSLVLSCTCAGIICGPLGIVLSIMGNKQKKTNVGTAGLICSIIGTSLCGLLYVVNFGLMLLSSV